MMQNKTKGEARINQSEGYSILWENTANYMKEIVEGHHLTVLGGYTLQFGRNEGLDLFGKNFTNDLLDWNNLSDAETKTRQIGSSASECSHHLLFRTNQLFHPRPLSDYPYRQI
ncbi:hypothetical protein NXY31_26590 [Bacteroides salyersiae]|nr:hypothetical protein [Bacteroides salyersiae]